MLCSTFYLTFGRTKIYRKPDEVESIVHFHGVLNITVFGKVVDQSLPLENILKKQKRVKVGYILYFGLVGSVNMG